MNGGAVSVSAGAGVTAYTIRAKKAMGPIITVEPSEFLQLLDRMSETPLVVVAKPNWFERKWKRLNKWKYLTRYKGLTFFTRSATELTFEQEVELVVTPKLWIM